MVARYGGEATAGGFPLGWWLPSRRRRPHLVDADLQPRAERGEMLVAHPDADGVIVVLGLILLVRERIGPDRVDPGRTGDHDGPPTVAIGIQIQADLRAGLDVRDLRGFRHRIHGHILAVEEEPHERGTGWPAFATVVNHTKRSDSSLRETSCVSSTVMIANVVLTSTVRSRSWCRARDRCTPPSSRGRRPCQGERDVLKSV